jgi:hypothetical protein
MATLTISLHDDVARFVEESALREHKSPSEWVQEHVASEADRAKRGGAKDVATPSTAYPPDWVALFGSLADDESFVAPSRAASRPVNELQFE